MDINMNNAQFVKENENGPGWIYLSKDGKSKDIKVFYDDGTFDNNYVGKDSLKKYYSDYMQTLNDLNGITALDNAGQVMDFAVTLAQTFGDKLEGITGATPTGTQIEYLKNYIYSKLDVIVSSGITVLGKDVQETGKKNFVLSIFNAWSSTKLGMGFLGGTGLFFSSYFPAVNAVMKKYKITSYEEFASITLKGEPYSYDDPTVNKYTNTVTVDQIKKDLNRELALNISSAFVMGKIMELGKSILSLPIIGPIIGSTLMISSKVISTSFRNTLSRMTNINDLSLDSIKNILKNSMDLTALKLDIVKACDSVKIWESQLFYGVNKNYLPWQLASEGKNIKYFTELNIKGNTGLVDTLFSLIPLSLDSLIDGEKTALLSSIMGVNKIITSFEGAYTLINKLGNDIDIPLLRGYFVDKSSDVSSDNIALEFNDPFIEINLEKGEIYLDSMTNQELRSFAINRLTEKMNSKLEEICKNEKFVINLNETKSHLCYTDLVKKSFELRGMSFEKLGFTTEEILNYNRNFYLEDKVFNNGKYFILDDYKFISDLLSIRIPTDGRVSTRDKFILGDNNVQLTGPGGISADGRDYNSLDEKIYGGSGNDTIYGGFGKDVISGGAGNDIIYGGEYNKKFVINNNDYSYEFYKNNSILDLNNEKDINDTDKSTDYIYGNEGNDYLVGGLGEDYIYGGEDNDTIFGGIELQKDTDDTDKSVDHLSGGEGNDHIYGGGGNDWIYGDAGDDSLIGGTGNDHIYGGDGNDILVAGKNEDEMSRIEKNYLYGGSGDDILLAETGVLSKRQILEGGDGFDTYIAQNAIINDSDGKGYIKGVSGTYKKVIGDLYKRTDADLYVYKGDNVEVVGRANGKNYSLTIVGELGMDLLDLDDVPPNVAEIEKQGILNLWGASKTARPRDPLVINFDKTVVEFSAVNEGVYFDLDASGTAERISWIKSNAGFLALDRNEDGLINNGIELFGDVNILKDGTKSTEGFQTLAEFDNNQDKVINKDDEIFSKLRIWKDDNFNGFSENSELKGLEELGIKEISLTTKDINSTSQVGNITSKQASVIMEDGSENTIIEYFLNRNTMDTVHPLEANEEAYNNLLKDTKDLDKYINIKGSGNLVNLNLALTQNSKLKSLLDEYYKTNGKADNLVEEIIKLWAQKNSHLEILESFIGEKFNGIYGINSVSSNIIEQAYQMLKTQVSSLLYAQKVASSEIAMLANENSETYFRIILDQNFYEGVAKLKSLKIIKNNLGKDLAAKFDSILSILQTDYSDLKDLNKFIINNDQSNLSTVDNIIYGNNLENIFENNTGNDQYVYTDNFYNIKDTIGMNSIKITNYEILKEDLDFIYSKDGLSIVYLNSTENKEIIRVNELENITNIEFADGTSLTYSEILEILMKKVSSTNGDDNVGYTFTKLIKDTLDGNDKVYSGKYDDIINGGRGNDEIYSGAGNDIIIGDKDNDYLNGGAGNDTYIFNKGDGQDIIADTQGNDIIKFGENIGIEDILLSTNVDGHIILKIKDSTDSITIREFNKNFSLEFINGTVINFSEILNKIKSSLETNEQNNEIIYNISEIEINAFAGNDTIKTGNYNDTIYGGVGNDSIYSNGGNDSVIGGQGNDYLEGGAGNDIYIFNKGDGQDIIYDLNDGNIIKFGEGIKSTDLNIYTNESGFIKIEVCDKENSILLKDFSKINKLVFSDNSEITYADLLEKSFNNINNITSVNDDIINYQFKGYEGHGLEGNDKIVGSNFDDKLYGDNDDDIIFGNAGNDYLEGGQGNDSIEGGSGSDTYFYNLGDGHDVYNENGWEKNRVVLGNNIKIEDFKVEAIGEDILIVFNDNDSIRLKSFYRYRNLFELKLADDTVLGFDALVKIAGKTVNVSDNNDNITYFLESSLEINTLGGDDIVKSGNYNDIINGGEGNDKIYSGYGNDILEGGKGDDYLEGGGGSDTYIFNKGDGFDNIYEFDYDLNNIDTIKFGENISKEDIVLTTKADGLEIGIKDSNSNEINDRIFIKNMDTRYGKIEKFEFSNGEVLDYLDFIKLAGSTNNDEFNWYSTAVNIDMNAGDDIVKTGNYNDIIKGGAGNDKIYSGYGDDILEGGKGNDYLDGGVGSDTYIFNKGDGFDNIYESDYYSNNIDTIKFGENISKENIVLTTKADGLEIGIKDSGSNEINDRIFIKYMDSYYSKIEKFEFSNGEVLDYLDFIKLAGSTNNDEFNWYSTAVNIDMNAGDDIVRTDYYNDIIKGGVGNDKIYSGYGDDILEGGKGNDYLEGGAGNDKYIFNKGDGFDNIYDYQGIDTIKFGENISKEDIILTTKADGLEIGIKDSNSNEINDRIFIKYMDTEYGKIEKFEFFSGETLNYLDFIKLAGSTNNDEFNWYSTAVNIDMNAGDDIVKTGYYNDIIKGEAGNDKIYSGYGDDILEGGKGNDYLEGGVGNDTYIYNIGDGSDVILDFMGNDIIQFGEDILYNDLKMLTDNDGNFVIEIKSTKERIKFPYENVNMKLRFIDGSEVNYNTLLKDLGTSEDNKIYWQKSRISIKSLEGNDEIYTGQYDDILEGGKGKDILSGGSGNNTYIFNLGDGEDTIKVSTNTDIIKFGEGITKENIVLTREGLNLIIYTSSTADKIIVENWYSSYKLNKIVFSDNSEMLKDEIHIKGLIVRGTSNNDKIDGLNTENDILYGLSGDDIMEGFAGDDVISGNEGNDTISGGLGNDILEGGKGKDSLSGGSGNNTYIFNLGDGEDTIKVSTNTDIIKFGEGITKENIVLTREGLNLIIYTSSTADKIIVENWYSSYKLNKIVFSDNSEMLKDEIHTKGLVVKGTSGKDELLGLEYENNVLYGLSGDDTIKGLSGNDVVFGNEGNDIIDVGFGKNIINYSLGDGNDIILNNTGEDKLILSGIKYEDIKSIIRINKDAKDVLVTLKNNETIKLISQNISNIETFIFDDKELLASEFIRLIKDINGSDEDDLIYGYETSEIISGGLGNDYISGEFGDDIIYGETGNDTLNGGEGNDILEGGLGDDIIYGETGNDTLNGGEGNDILEGGLGDDIYTFGKGSRNDTILEQDYLGNNDKIILLGLNQSDMTISRDNDDLLLTINSSGEILTVSGYFNGVNSKVETFEFSDGTILNSENIKNIFGYNKAGYRITINSDTFDIELKRSGVYIKISISQMEFGGIHGNYYYSGYQEDLDNFVDSGLKDELASQLDKFMSQFMNSNIKLSNIEEDVMTYEGEFREILTQCFEFKKEDVTETITQEINLDNTKPLNIIGTNADDVIAGNRLNDILDGKAGNDFLDGGTGNDTYIFARGYGQDSILDIDSTKGNIDKIFIKDAIATDINVSRVNNNLELSIKNSSDKITIIDFFKGLSNQIESVLFSDGSSWTKDMIYQKLGFNLSGYRMNVNSSSFDISFKRMDVTVKLSVQCIDNKLSSNYMLNGSTAQINALNTAGENTILANQINSLMKNMINSDLDFNDMATTIKENDAEFRDILTQSFEFRKGAATDTITQEITFTGDTAIYPGKILNGTADLDTLAGNRGNDTLDGGIGNDILDGGTGNDTYIFGKGYGVDTILDNDSTLGNIDKVKFKDILASEISAIRNGNNLELSIISSTDKVVVTNFFNGLNNQIELVEFSDGVTWTKEVLYQKLGYNLTGYRMNVTDTAYSLIFKRMAVAVTVNISFANNQLSASYGFSGTTAQITALKSAGEDVKIGNQISTLMQNMINTELNFSTMKTTIKNNENLIREILTQSFEFKQETLIDSLTQEISYQGETSIPANMNVLGSSSSDILTGNRGNDVLDSLAGNDMLDGGTGNDTYIFGKGYGIDTIYENDSTSGNVDKIKFKDVNPDEVELKQVGNNLEVIISGTTDKIIVNNYYVSTNNKVEQIEFMDGTIWNPDNVITGTSGIDTLSGKVIQSGLAGNDTLTGTTGIDTLYGGLGNDSLDGAAANDNLYGGLGNDTYIFGKGYGIDTIYENDSTSGNIDKVKFKDVNPDGVELKQVGNNLEISISGTTDKIVINNYFVSGNNKVEQIEFMDGTIWNPDNVLVGTASADTLSGKSIISGLAGDDIINGSLTDDMLYGGAGVDTITGNAGNDTIDGGIGNDSLNGGIGNDTYVFAKGYGTDTITDLDSTIGNIDTIKMRDITSTIAVAARNGNNLEITATGFTDKLIVSNYFSGTNNKVEKIVFSDNIVWDKNTVSQKAGLNVTSYNLELKGTTFDLTFVRDNVTVKTTFSVVGGVFTASTPAYSGTTTNLTAFTAAKKTIVTNQITQFKTDFINAGLGLTDWNNQLTANSRILDEIISQSFEFKGTSVVDTMTATTNSMFLSGGSGADVITGNTGNDVLIGGAGNDTLKGAAGNDTYIFGRGDGIDTVTDTAGADILRINANPLDLIFAQTGTDLDISINGTTDKVTVKSWFSGATNQIEKIVANDTELLLNTSVQGMIQAMSAFDSTNQMTWSQSIQNKPKETTDVLSQYWGHQTTMVK